MNLCFGAPLALGPAPVGGISQITRHIKSTRPALLLRAAEREIVAVMVRRPAVSVAHLTARWKTGELLLTP